jgi:hypothetical protein
MAKFFVLLKETAASRQKKETVSLFCSQLFVTLPPYYIYRGQSDEKRREIQTGAGTLQAGDA